MVLGGIFAILAALVWALSLVSIGRKLGQSNFFTVTLIIALIGNLLLWPAALLQARDPFNLLGALVFALGGFLKPGLVRLFYFKGMEEVGVSVNASIVAIYPMFSTILAVLLLGERPTTWMLAGVVCVVLGAATVESSMHGDRVSRGHWRRLLFPFFTAAVNGAAYVVNKVGLSLYDEPVAGPP